MIFLNKLDRPGASFRSSLLSLLKHRLHPNPMPLTLGKVTWQSNLLNTSRNQKEKVAKLLLLYASEEKEIDELLFGSVGVILGLKYTRTGDTLVSAGTSEKFQSTMRDITPPSSGNISFCNPLITCRPATCSKCIGSTVSHRSLSSQ